MMKIISHRGYWSYPEEKNTKEAFLRSFSHGYGTETDVRDFSGKLLISHDMAIGNEIHCEDVLKLASKGFSSESPLTLALNIKADGLAISLKQLLDRYPTLDAFVFDMSIPDMRSYLECGIPVFTRCSEVEPHPVWLDHAVGVWLDGFASEWYDLSLIESFLDLGKRVCIVSSELHKRPFKNLWQRIKPLVGQDSLMLCTDVPEEASRFFFD